MELEKAFIQEQKLNKIAAYAPYLHCIGFTTLLLLSSFKSKYYAEITQGLTYTFLILTFVINRIYIHAGKELEKLRELSGKEKKQRKIEYLMKFFAPIVFWTGCILILPN